VLFYSIVPVSPSARRPSLPRRSAGSWPRKVRIRRAGSGRSYAGGSLAVSPDGKTLPALTADGGVSLRVFDLGPAD
jgi:hypothetical protein